MNYFTVDILGPSSIIAKDLPAESLLIPTVRGQINVLPEHTHIVTQLGTGSMTVHGGADDPDRYFVVTSGICKVLHKKVIILSPAAEEDFEINLERAKAALDHSLQKLAGSELTDLEFEKFTRKAERARIRIQMAENYFSKSKNKK